MDFAKRSPLVLSRAARFARLKCEVGAEDFLEGGFFGGTTEHETECALGGNRTPNLGDRSALLCPLSYEGIVPLGGIEPPPHPFQGYALPMSYKGNKKAAQNDRDCGCLRAAI